MSGPYLRQMRDPSTKSLTMEPATVAPVAERAATSEAVDIARQPVPPSLRHHQSRLTVRLQVELEGHQVLVDLAQSGDSRALEVALGVLTTVRDQLASSAWASGRTYSDR